MFQREVWAVRRIIPQQAPPQLLHVRRFLREPEMLLGCLFKPACRGFLMLQLCIRSIDVAVAGFSHAQTEIDIVKGHWQRFVEAAHLLEDLFSHDKTGRCNGAIGLNEVGPAEIAILIALEISMRVSGDTTYAKDDASMLHGSVGIP